MRRFAYSIILLMMLQITGTAFGQSAPSPEIAPNGKLRSGMIGITVLGGVAEPVAKFVAEKLGVSFERVMYPNPEAYAKSFGKGGWDLAVGPRVLATADKADQTADLWLIDLIYVAAPGHDFANASQVDRAGVNVGVIEGSPSDRLLSHNLKSAKIVRIPLSPHIAADAADLLLSGKADVFGADSSVGYPAAAALSGARVVSGTFNIVRVSAALPRGKSPEAQAKLAEIVSEAKRTGIVQKAIESAGLKGVHVAP